VREDVHHNGNSCNSETKQRSVRGARELHLLVDGIHRPLEHGDVRGAVDGIARCIYDHGRSWRQILGAKPFLFFRTHVPQQRNDPLGLGRVLAARFPCSLERTDLEQRGAVVRGRLGIRSQEPDRSNSPRRTEPRPTRPVRPPATGHSCWRRTRTPVRRLSPPRGRPRPAAEPTPTAAWGPPAHDPWVPGWLTQWWAEHPFRAGRPTR